MPVGRPDFWYGQVLLFEQAPTDGRTDAGPTSDWAHDHAADPAAHGAGYTDAQAVAAMGAKADANPLNHDRYTNALALVQAQSVIDDTPDNADVTHAPSSNWAYDHKADAAAHHEAFTAANADTKISTHTAIAAAHHEAFTAANADTKIATHTAIASAHHAAFVSADAAALILTHKNIAAAHHTKTVSSEIDHGSVTGLADDDHTQYLHLSTERSLLKWLKFVNQTILVRIYKDATAKFQWRSDPDGAWPFVIYNETTTTYIFSMDDAGNIVNVGTVDGVDISAHAANASAHHVKYTDAEAAAAAKPYFTDRGDPAAVDKTQATLTCDSTWRDWNLSAIVPAGATAVLIRVCMQRDDAGGNILLRKNGNSNSFNVGGTTHGEAGAIGYGEITVACDANRVIEYYGIGATWTILNLTVGGWWK